eukprot:gnl/TRDRNA2_/TRDRNA2_60139_c0_seq1.p1 gnl/TRDRNA2_/TRDRNA2_60139_c0~~gnl/TRDRNA2_/TRDRNA2_60139_c0_seq1.p1  ORF type:complete len:208 (+),score=27.67 gnl/TRDRNA2_/TRDRNA2_60139_c0_seq1:2-625(+)
MGSAWSKVGNDPEAGKEAAALHDKINVFCITPIVGLTIWSLAGGGPPVRKALTWSTLCYILYDIGYHFVVPNCQPSRFRLSTILFHHVVTAWLVAHPAIHPEQNTMTALSTIVEINTLVLTLQKCYKRQAYQIAFYATWVGMRLAWYPYLIYYYYLSITSWQGYKLAPGYYMSQVVGTQIALCSLNFLWTAEVIYNMLNAKKKDKEA